MELAVSFAGRTYAVGLDRPRSLAIPLRFGGAQPGFFGAPPAAARPLAAGGFVGDTTQGGSCNVSELRLVPHCNGTHTESLAHVLHDAPTVADVLPQGLMPALLASVTPAAQGGDRVVTRDSVEAALADHDDEALAAMIVRTLPNDASKLTAVYDDGNQPPFFAADAMDAIVARGVRHLLVDFPSIDRMHDDGRLANHRTFWDVAGAVQAERTVTEMIFVADDISDGTYLLDLQIPAFASDAAPSRPVIYPLVERA